MKLSICIPTYNRTKYLPELLDSIIKQANDEIEIVISDNASKDNTKEIVENYKRRFKNIVYFCWERNMGADRNFLKVVEIANGEYCWLMGSDDRIEDGGVDSVLKFIEINREITGLSLNVNAYDIEFNNLINKRPISGKEIEKDLVLNNLEDIVVKFFDYFGYLSGQVINRKLWNEVVENKKEVLENYFNAYVHVFIITNMIKKRPLWGYISKPCVGWRSGNDSFLSELGLYKRLELDVVGYEKISGDIFGRKSFLYKRIKQIIFKVHVKYGLLNIVMNLKNKYNFSLRIKVFVLLYKYYKFYLFFWIFYFPLILTPRFFLLIIRFLWRKTFKKYFKYV